MSLDQFVNDPVLSGIRKYQVILLNVGYVVIPIFLLSFISLGLIQSFLIKEFSSDFLLSILVFFASFSGLCFAASGSASKPYKERYHLVGERLLNITILLSIACLSLLFEDTLNFFQVNALLSKVVALLLATIYLLVVANLVVDALLLLFVSVILPRYNDELIKLYKAYDKIK